ncbi:hypothetical protein [Telluria aromaticivorans]|uniref:Uncharacterized protein n=1 Tax=Telluria aromaticivorans TaxID=2725995 RepID=A0A7Y2NXT3_9BURK|nr:hypothetical protein [Telluria aromaticivorans]NNG22062.1 hypothetical protein [Telluria aromaticivorans]
MPDALVAFGLSPLPGQQLANWQLPVASYGMAPGVLAGGIGDGGRYPAGFAALQAARMAGFPFGMPLGGLGPMGW